MKVAAWWGPKELRSSTRIGAPESAGSILRVIAAWARGEEVGAHDDGLQALAEVVQPIGEVLLLKLLDDLLVEVGERLHASAL